MRSRVCPMIDVVLRRLESLQAELANLDPLREVNVTDHVAAMAQALRDVLGEAGQSAATSSDRTERVPLRALAG